MQTNNSMVPPCVERRPGLMLGGLRRSYTVAGDLEGIMQGVAGQWHAFHAREAQLGCGDGVDRYGVLRHIAEGETRFEYFCGIAVPRTDDLPDGFWGLVVPPLRCAVFRHEGPASMLPTAYFAIFGTLLPEAGLAPADPALGYPEFIERFDERYDLRTGTGGPEILVPLAD